MMPDLFPAFLKLAGRKVLLVGAGPVGASKLQGLLDAGALVTVVAPEVHPDVAAAPVAIHRRPFEVSDLDDVWYVVAAAPPEVNRAVAAAAAERCLFVNAVDDPPNATVYLGGVVRREGVTVAISTSGRAPALAGLLREGIDALLPRDLPAWLEVADRERARWKAEAVPMEARRGQLLDALNAIYAKPASANDDAANSTGVPLSSPAFHGVSLVGAGPGDPGLLTLRAVQRLQQAELVLYDALVSPDVLKLAAHAQCVSVGKRHGRHSVSQNTINRLLVRNGKRGRRVVRLKAGDPFVFGRGGEEALALAAAGVPFEVVPGVSSAVSAPALAGIPVTHRGIASSFVVVSGHAEPAWAPVVEGLTPQSATVVVLMGVNTRAQLAARLIARGWPAMTPAALLFSASTPDATSWFGSLAELAAGEDLSTPDGPGTLVIGEVVKLASVLGAAGTGNIEDDVEVGSLKSEVGTL